MQTYSSDYDMVRQHQQDLWREADAERLAKQATDKQENSLRENHKEPRSLAQLLKQTIQGR